MNDQLRFEGVSIDGTLAKFRGTITIGGVDKLSIGDVVNVQVDGASGPGLIAVMCPNSRTTRFDDFHKVPGTAPTARCRDCEARVGLYTVPRRPDRLVLVAHDRRAR